jgi:hypothetical protein
LVVLRELRRFYASFVSPRGWSREYESYRASYEAARPKERELKRLAEREVLGEWYELQCEGVEPEESVWRLQLDRDC